MHERRSGCSRNSECHNHANRLTLDAILFITLPILIVSYICADEPKLLLQPVVLKCLRLEMQREAVTTQVMLRCLIPLNWTGKTEIDILYRFALLWVRRPQLLLLLQRTAEYHVL